VANAWENIPQLVFFNARHSAELPLKPCSSGCEQDKRMRFCYSLTMLLAELATCGDDLFGVGEDQQLIVEFIRERDRRDLDGDQGRSRETPMAARRRRSRVTPTAMSSSGMSPGRRATARRGRPAARM
jgi:hypothetical protein